MPKAEETRVEAPEVLPLLLPEEEGEPLLLDEPVEEGREAEPELETRPVDMEEAADEEEGATEEEGTMDWIPLEMVAVVLQLEVLGVE